MKSDENLQLREEVRIKTNLLEEILNDDIEQLHSLKEQEAKVGHKSADTSFFGYKNQIAMTPERIITGIIVSKWEKADGKFTQELIEQSQKNGIQVDTLIGDGAYSGKDDLKYGKENNITMVTPLNPSVYQEMEHAKKYQGFSYNKDAGMYVCKAVNMGQH